MYIESFLQMFFVKLGSFLIPFYCEFLKQL